MIQTKMLLIKLILIICCCKQVNRYDDSAVYMLLSNGVIVPKANRCGYQSETTSISNAATL